MGAAWALGRNSAGKMEANLLREEELAVLNVAKLLPSIKHAIIRAVDFSVAPSELANADLNVRELRPLVTSSLTVQHVFRYTFFDPSAGKSGTKSLSPASTVSSTFVASFWKNQTMISELGNCGVLAPTSRNSSRRVC